MSRLLGPLLYLWHCWFGVRVLGGIGTGEWHILWAVRNPGKPPVFICSCFEWHYGEIPPPPF